MVGGRVVSDEWSVDSWSVDDWSVHQWSVAEWSVEERSVEEWSVDDWSVVLQSSTENSLLSSDVTYLKLSRNSSISVSMTCGAT